MASEDKPIVEADGSIPAVDAQARLGLPGSEGEHRLQEKYGKTTHARAFYTHQVIDHLNSTMREFVARQELMFIATSDAKGETDAGFRAGHAGFVKVLDERMVAYPEYRGSGVMANLGNITENPNLALLFIDFSEQIGLHVHGKAKIVENEEFLQFLKEHPAEQAVLGDAVLKDILESDGGHLERWVMLSVKEAFVQCSKHIPPMQRMDHSIEWGKDTGHHVHGGDYFGTAHGRK